MKYKYLPPDFKIYLKNYIRETYRLFWEVNSNVVVARKEEKIKKEKEHKRLLEERKQLLQAKADKEEKERLRKRNERNAELAKERKKRKRENEKWKEGIRNIMGKRDRLAKQHGFSGYDPINIVNLMRKTQREGGLENYINKVIGSINLNDNVYTDLKILQVLDNGLLYSYSSFWRYKYVDFIIACDREKGKIYQEGQCLENSLYVFKGMITYNSILGTKTVPYFSKVKF